MTIFSAFLGMEPATRQASAPRMAALPAATARLGEWFYGNWLQSLHTTITFCEVSLNMKIYCCPDLQTQKALFIIQPTVEA